MNSYRILIKDKHLLSSLEQKVIRSLMSDKGYIEAIVTTNDEGCRSLDIAAGLIFGSDDGRSCNELTLLKHCLINYIRFQLKNEDINYYCKICTKFDNKWENMLSIKSV